MKLYRLLNLAAFYNMQYTNYEITFANEWIN